jgi:hypothetical protein
MPTTFRKATLLLLWVIGMHSFALPTAHPQTASAKPIETTITELIKSTAKFNGKRVRVPASFHTDGMHVSVLLEPNCGLFDGTSKTAPPGQPQCYRGVAASESAKLEGDPENKRLDEILGQGEHSTRDKHITAEFTGVFNCRPSCISPKRFVLDIERIDKLEVVWKNLKPHWPTQ